MNLLRKIVGRHDKNTVAADAERRTATQIYLDGGGDPSAERTMALLAEADRSVSRHPQAVEALHAHQITPDDAVMLRMMSGAHFGPEVVVTLPSGITITGAEMQRWLEANL